MRVPAGSSPRDRDETESLVSRLLVGDARALARLITLVESGDSALPSLMAQLAPHLGGAYVVGVTGPPGAGKSTLVDQMVARLRRQGEPVGILAVDPSSPFTGGALLGDRIRMQQHTLDPGVFLRSLATRGQSGGLSTAVRGAVKVLDAAGKSTILVETVGVGQTELEILQVADTVVVVLVPEAGDAIQALKAGLLEIAHLFVVNKADREGATRFRANLRSTLSLLPAPPGWKPPILMTRATEGEGVDDLLAQIQAHRQHATADGSLEARRQARRRYELLALVAERLRRQLEALLEADGALQTLAEEVALGRLDPYTAADRVMALSFGSASA